MSFRRVACVLVACLLPLTACEDDPPKPDPSESQAMIADVEEALAAIDGVLGVDASQDPWEVDVDQDHTPQELNAIGTEIFEVWNEAEFEGRPGLVAMVGTISATVEYDPEQGGAPAAPPALGWAGLGSIRSLWHAEIAENRFVVQLQSGADSVAWVKELAERDLDALEGIVSVGRQDEAPPTLRLTPSDEDQVALLESTAAVADENGVDLLEFEGASAGRTTTAARTDDLAAARSFVNALGAGYEALGFQPDGAELSIAAAGTTWRGTLDEIGALLDAEGGTLPQAVAATGATLDSSDGERYAMSVPSAEELGRLIDLLGSDEWTPGGDAGVSIEVGDNTNASRLSASMWAEHGSLLVAAIDAGYANTRITSGRGGQQERTFDIDFRNSEGIDITTEDGWRPIIEMLRAHDYPGRLQIGLSEGDHLIFWSEATGEAEDPYFALHDAETREIHGWAQEFIDAWNATAG